MRLNFGVFWRTSRRAIRHYSCRRGLLNKLPQPTIPLGMLLPVTCCSRRVMTLIAGLSLLSVVRAGCGCFGDHCSSRCGAGTYLTGKSNCNWVGCDCRAVCSPIPTPRPTSYPTAYPTSSPTASPSPYPTPYPTPNPTPTPTTSPTSVPTASPSAAPSAVPTDSPTHSPTKHPCTDESHGCDLSSTYCASDEISSAYTCACLEGFITIASNLTSCLMTLSPTAVPTESGGERVSARCPCPGPGVPMSRSRRKEDIAGAEGKMQLAHCCCQHGQSGRPARGGGGNARCPCPGPGALKKPKKTCLTNLTWNSERVGLAHPYARG
jgi:hypothetical protein